MHPAKGGAIPLTSILLLGFFLGMRHATDADHVAAVTTIVSREKSLWRAAFVGAAWGIGHTATILLVGGAIVLFGVTISPRVGLTMELSVGLMLVVLGGISLFKLARPSRELKDASVSGAWDRRLSHIALYRTLRPLVIGVVHGLAGSAAVTLLVVPTIASSSWALVYLVVFGAGTIAGMMLVTTGIALPFRLVQDRFARAHKSLVLVSALLSIAIGLVAVHRIGFVQGLFSEHPSWTPE